MKKFLLICLFVISSFAIDWAGKVTWAMNYYSAKRLSAQTHKPILVDIALSHCPPCKWISQNLYTDDKIASFINKNFIPVLIIVDKEALPEELSNYFTGSTPTIMILNSKGMLITQFVGLNPAIKQNKDLFINYLKKGLKK